MKQLKLVLSFLAGMWLCSVYANGQAIYDYTGTFLDTLKIPGNELRLAITISRDDDEVFRATFNSLDQGSGEINFDEVIVDGLHIVLKSKAGIEIEGDYNADFTKITGEFRQGPARFQMKFLRVEQLPVYNRPQEPQRPYPYMEEDVVYKNEMAGIELAGTLTMPEGAGPFPAVVLLSGSGPQNRNEEVYGHKPFLVLADYLTRNGIAVLRADDRGVGGSGGQFEGSTTEDFALDGLAGVDFLKSRPEIMKTKIGMIGHSEGGMMASLAAIKSDDVAFIVLLAGPGSNLGDNVVWQYISMMKKAGAPDEYLSATKKYLLALNEAARSEISDEEVREEAKRIYEQLNEDERHILKLSDEQIAASAGSVMGNWWRYGLRFNPEETLRAVKVPVLAILGEKDQQVPVELNHAALERAISDGHSKNKVVVLPGLNHLFQTSETGDGAEYIKLEETLSPSVMELMVSWINDL